MKKKVFSLLLVFVLLGSLSVCAFAENGKVWNVTFTADGKMSSDFKSSAIAETIGSLEPGDSVTFSVQLTNSNSSATNWYMTNEVVKTLEKNSSASGGAYTYILSYTDASGGTKEFYNSDKVGGDDTTKIGSEERQGLEEATIDLEDYFFLSTLNSGTSGMVNLSVGLDGESQGNVYQGAYGDLKMNFAVELTNTSNPPGRTPPVKTGDETNLTPYYIVMVVSGLLLLYLALDAVTDRIYGRKRG